MSVEAYYIYVATFTNRILKFFKDWNQTLEEMGQYGKFPVGWRGLLFSFEPLPKSIVMLLTAPGYVISTFPS